MQRCGHRGITENSAVKWLSKSQGGLAPKLRDSSQNSESRSICLPGTDTALSQGNFAGRGQARGGFTVKLGTFRL